MVYQSSTCLIYATHGYNKVVVLLIHLACFSLYEIAEILDMGTFLYGLTLDCSIRAANMISIVVDLVGLALAARFGPF